MTFFENEPLTDFTVEANRKALRKALSDLDQKVKSKRLHAKPILGGKELDTSENIEELDPSDPKQVLGKVGLASVAHADQAIELLTKHAKSWAATSASERIEIIRKAAALMRERKHELSALIIRSAAKPWKEADADVAEAIDFCDFYAVQMEQLAKPHKVADVLGEDNVTVFIPRGLATVISPWNFPLAIPCGMTVAALIAGNVAILKPAEQTSLIAYEFAKILLEAGIPKNAFAFLPGEGESVGVKLVGDPRVDLICFTGSKGVGLDIIRKAGDTGPQQRSVKHVVLEMGGKNAIIIDEDADLDEAVKGVLYSAFGYAGQKCSACSRAIVVGDAYEPFLKRLGSAASDLIQGPAQEPGTFVPPVIDAVSRDRVLQVIERGQKENPVLFKSEPQKTGFFVPVTIFRDVPETSFIWREELFAPVLACTQAKDFAHALDLANGSEYALTGGVFSRSPKNIASARSGFLVGNLYINRGCTGAMVGRHPFGGFRLSGAGTKAGGEHYLLHFMLERTITENTMRRGFSPDLPS